MDESRIDYILDGVAFAGTLAQTEQILRYISLALTIICTAISVAYSVYKWWKKAKEDGKITKEEVDELKKGFEQKIKEVHNDKKEGE